MADECIHCKGTGIHPDTSGGKQRPCPACRGTGHFSLDDNSPRLVTHYVSTAERSTPTQPHATRLLFACTIGFTCFLIAQNLLDQEPWTAAFFSGIATLTAWALSFAFPILLSLFRWFLILAIGVGAVSLIIYLTNR